MFLKGFAVVFAGVLAVGNGNRCSSKTDIELYDPVNSKYQCWPAPDCHDGQEPSVEPGSTHPKGTAIDCKPCQEGVTYSNRETNYRCHKCTTNCGNKVVRSTCTIFRDRLCDNHCISTEFYLNATDDECYPCTECCGANDANIELQCLSTKAVHIGSVIGEKGALHCKVLSSQQCDELLKYNPSPIVNNSSVLNDTSASVFNHTSGLEKKCNGIENNSSSSNNSSSVFKEKCTCSWSLDSLHLVLIGGFVFMAFVCVVLIYLCKRERKMRSTKNDYFPSSGSCSCFSSSAGHRCRGDCEMTCFILPFSEKLKVIPEEVILNSLIPYDVKEHIKKLDAKKRLAKTWYDVGCKLEMSEDDLNLIKREDNREDGSPTSVLLDKLSTWENVISLRRFVQVLHDLKRNDIANPIIEFYKQPNTSVSNV